MWDAQTGQELLTLKGHTGWSAAWPSARTANAWPALADDETVKVWDAQTGQELLSLKGHTDGRAWPSARTASAWPAG